MKKILFTLMILAMAGVFSTARSQCTVQISNVAVQIVNAVPDPGDPSRCIVTANVQFDLLYNNGATFVYFNSYLATDYANLATTNPLDFECANANTPARNAPDAGRLGTTLTQLGKSFLDVGLDLSAGHGAVGVPIPTPVLTTYSQDPTVALNTPANSGGFTVTRTFISGTTDHFVVQGLTVTVNAACGGPLEVETDIWASNANSANAKAQCYVCGVSQFFNDPVISGFKTCERPDRKYTLGVTTIQPGIIPITIKIFADEDNDGLIDDDGDLNFNEAGEDVMVLPAPISHNLSTGNPYTSGGPVSYPPYSSDPAIGDLDLLVLVEGPSLTNDVIKEFSQPTGCIGLPVDFKSFTATRINRGTVLLKWETSLEQNAEGFAIERNTHGNWQQVAFIPSQAPGGNSNETLAYTYSDANAIKGMSQYRIKQVDLDARAKYSIIRAVRGDGQTGKTIIYPNPASDGKVTVVFEDASVIRDVYLSDMTGRMLKQWKGVTNNNIQIENLAPGVFTLRIVVPVTGEQSVEKIVVNKR